MTSLSEIVRGFRSAVRAAAAAEGGYAPARADLKRLGIDHNAYAQIARR